MKETSDYQNSPSEPGHKRGIQTGKAVGHGDENPRRTVTRKEQGSKNHFPTLPGPGGVWVIGIKSQGKESQVMI